MKQTKIFAALALLVAVLPTTRTMAQFYYGDTFPRVTPSGHTLNYTVATDWRTDPVTGNEYYYNLVVVSGFAVGSTTDSNLIIPATVTLFEDADVPYAYPVEAIVAAAFSGTDFLKSVTINGYQMKRIGNDAFSGCSNLTDVTLPSSVKLIGSWAFQSCKIRQLVVPSGIDSIAPNAFYSSLPNGSFDGVRTVVYYGPLTPEWDNPCWGALYWAKMEDNGLYYTNSNKDTIVGCTNNITNLAIPNSVSTIGRLAFEGNENITSVSIPHGVQRIGYGAFLCPNLATVSYNATTASTYTTYQDYRYFSPSVSSFTFGDSVRQIPASLLYGITGITSLTIPAQVEQIGIHALACPNLSSLQWNATRATYGSYYGSLSPSNSPFYCNMPVVGEDGYSINNITFFAPISNLVIGDGVKSLPNLFLYADTALTSVSFPASLDSIGTHAFYYTRISELTIPQTIKYIGAAAFSSIPTLTSLNWNAKRVELGVPNNYYEEPQIFAGNRIHYYSGGLTYDFFSPIASVSFGDSVEAIPENFLMGDTMFVSVVLPDSVKSIGDMAFYGTHLTEITIPEGVDSIGSFAFVNNHLEQVNYNATAATYAGEVPFRSYSDSDIAQTLTIGSNVRMLSPNAFSEMKIHSVELPDSLQSIGSRCFSSSKLDSILIPRTVTYIGNVAFAHCNNLSKVVIDSSIAPIGDYAFYRDTNLIDVEMGNGVTSIGEYAFDYCRNLEEIVIGDGVTSIGNGAFYQRYTPALRRVTIGKSVSSIGANAFKGMTSPDTLFIRAEEPPTITSNTFESMPTNTRIMLPCGTLDDYKDAAYWNIFTKMAEDDSCYMTITATSSNLAMGTVSGGGKYSIGNVATLSAMPRKDYAFMGWSDYSSDNPRLVVVTGDASYEALFASTPTEVVHDTVTNTVYDTITNTVYDTIVNTEYDTITNIVYDTILSVEVDTMYIHSTDTLWLTDTVVVHDTIYITEQVVDNVQGLNAKIYATNGYIVVDGAENNTIWIYDAAGRVLAIKSDEYAPVRFEVPASGAYLVKIGDYPARRVVVIR